MSYHWFYRIFRLKSFYFRLWGPFCSAERSAILGEGIMKNILNLVKWFRRSCCLNIVLCLALAPIWFGGAEGFVQFIMGIM